MSERRSWRQPWSGVLHLAGTALAVAGLIWLVRLGSDRSGRHVAAVAVFGATMVLAYAASSLYHLWPATERGATRLRRLDHAAIYLFIAGSYTPTCLLGLSGGWRWGMLGAVWTIAVAGVLTKLLWIESSRWLRIGLYLAMGWLSVIVLPQLWEVLPARGFGWLAAGGLAYTGGSVIYALRRPDPFPTFLGFHEIWHVAVLAGSFCHFWFMRECVLFL